MSSALRIREAVESDLPAIVAMIDDDDLSSGQEDPSLPLDPAYANALREMHLRPGNIILVAETGGDDRPSRLVACLQYVVIPGISRRGMRRAQLEHVRVASDVRGEGVGRALVEEAIERARADGCGMVQLTANVARPDAHRFYESLGFTASHRGFKLRFE